MTYCFGKFKKKKSSQDFADIQNINIDAIPYEIVYSSKEKKILQFVNSTNELLEQITSHEISRTMNIQKINIPRIVLTGTQSSGKSSIVNRFIGRTNIVPLSFIFHFIII